MHTYNNMYASSKERLIFNDPDNENHSEEETMTITKLGWCVICVFISLIMFIIIFMVYNVIYCRFHNCQVQL